MRIQLGRADDSKCCYSFYFVMRIQPLLVKGIQFKCCYSLYFVMRIQQKTYCTFTCARCYSPYFVMRIQLNAEGDGFFIKLLLTLFCYVHPTHNA